MKTSAIFRWFAAGMLLLPCAGLAQQPATADKSAARPQFSNAAAKTGQLVDVFTVVADRRNGPLTGLRREDFQILADKRPQTISEFAVAKDLPLTLGLVVDASPAQRAALEEEKTASATFFGNLLAEGNKTKAFVVQFGRDVDLLQDTTGSRD